LEITLDSGLVDIVGSTSQEVTPMLHTYNVRVRLNGGIIPVTVQARNPLEARMMVEAQYGPGTVVETPQRG
jgi:hypothetical protein